MTCALLPPPTQESLRSCRALVSLGLRGNGIGERGADAVASALRALPSGVALDIRDNRLKDQGAFALAEALAGAPRAAAAVAASRLLRPSGRDSLDSSDGYFLDLQRSPRHVAGRCTPSGDESALGSPREGLPPWDSPRDQSTPLPAGRPGRPSDINPFAACSAHAAFPLVHLLIGGNFLSARSLRPLADTLLLRGRLVVRPRVRVSAASRGAIHCRLRRALVSLYLG